MSRKLEKSLVVLAFSLFVINTSPPAVEADQGKSPIESGSYGGNGDILGSTAVESVAEFFAVPDCSDTTECGIQSVADCMWQQPPSDAVESRMSAMGIVLDGYLGDALHASDSCEFNACGGANSPCPDDFFRATQAVAQIDAVSCFDGTGWCDEPLSMSPSGFNIECSLLWFVPDSDPFDGVDDSFIYVAWDIADSSVNRPRQYDADYDGSACLGWGWFDERGLESYDLRIRGGCSLADFDSTSRYTNDLMFAADTVWLEMQIRETGPLYSTTFLIASNELGLETLSFPTADAMFPDDSNATNKTNGCIDNEIDFCATKACSVSERILCTGSIDCPGSETCELSNNIELIIKRVESSGLFGPHGRECSVSSDPCMVDSDCLGGQTCESIVSPDTVEAKENRMALAQLVAKLGGSSQSDSSGEESAVVAAFTSLPEINVTKKVRCVDLEPTGFDSHIEVLPGSQIEFEITITNTGNELLTITVEDLMQAAGLQAGYVGITPVCDFLEARLSSPRRGLEDYPVTPVNANAPPICSVSNDPDCLNPTFFFPSCDIPFGVSFLETVENGVPCEVGGLLGCVTSNGIDGCEFIGGDTLVINFRANVDVIGGFCGVRENIDAENGVSVSGALPSEPGTIVIADTMNIADTVMEQYGSGDDNVSTIDLLCRDVNLSKQVRKIPNGEFTDSLAILPFAEPLIIEFRYEYGNYGEVDETVVLVDQYLCQDIAATAGVALISDPAGICVPPVGEIADMVPSDVVASYTCQVQFADYGAFRDFITIDDARVTCTGTSESGGDREKCYRNCIVMNADAASGSGICNSGQSLEYTANAQLFVPEECSILPGDFDCDGDVDLEDFAVFQAYFTGPE